MPKGSIKGKENQEMLLSKGRNMHSLLLAPATSHWTVVLNFIIQNLLIEWTTVCIVKSKNIPFELNLADINEKLHQFIIIEPKDLGETFDDNTFNFDEKKNALEENSLSYDDLTLKLTVSIENSYCEAFVVFQELVPVFAKAFLNASLFSDWKSTRNRFIFLLHNDSIDRQEYFDNWFFKDQSHFIIVGTDNFNGSNFDIKTNRFVGHSKDIQEQFYLLNRFDAKAGTLLLPEAELFPNKIKNLQGREVILGAFDYRPFVVVDYEREPNAIDHAEDNPAGAVRVDGAEARVLFTFCEVYNCTVAADTTKGDWGHAYPNMSGDGFRLKLLGRTVDVTMGANYYWIQPYIDRSHYIGFSAITLLVPRPQADITWNLPLKPFQLNLWLGICVVLLLEAVSLLFTREMEQIFEDPSKHTWPESLKYGYITALKLFISQNSDYEATSVSLRTLLLACYMNDIILTSIYGGGLASVLTLPALAEAPDNLERFVKFGLIWTAETPVWTEPFENADQGSLEDKFVAAFRVNNLDRLREMAKSENVGFVIERMMNGHFGNFPFLSPEALDHLKVMVEDLSVQYTICFVPRNWAILEQLNEFIMNWHTGGFGLFWEWKAAADFMNQNEQGRVASSKHLGITTGPEKLDMTHFAGVMLILVVGLIISILAFALEILQVKYELSKVLKRKFLNIFK